MDAKEAKLIALRMEHAHRAPSEADQRLLGELRQKFLDLAVWVEMKCPDGRAKALVQTKLDEARQWACNAVVSRGEVRGDLQINVPN
ncbi:MAG: hypothetical protein IOD15_10210 [Phycisphaerales bacterium]|nr:hypothetical protein [Phycisphaerales bacterium]